MHAVYAVNWTEHERGWGTRPDGHTLHSSLEEANRYIADYWDKQPSGFVPDEYSAPSEPKLVHVDDDTYINVSNVGSIWGHNSQWI